MIQENNMKILKQELQEKNKLIKSLENQLNIYESKISVYDETQLDTLNKNIILLMNDHSINVFILINISGK